MSSLQSIGKWVVCPHPIPHARIRLLCFPFAGGGVLSYRTWWQDLPSDVEVGAIQLPGRDGRRPEPPFVRLGPLVRAIVDAIGPALKTPFAFFGHSMGALVAFEVARELRRRRAPLPTRLFASARRAPGVPDLMPPLHLLSDAALADRLRRMKGTPEAVLREPELLALVLPILRADFTVNADDALGQEEPLDIPISAFGGLDDELATSSDLEAWREHTTSEFSKEILPGDHFFLVSARDALLRSVSRGLI